MRQSVGPENRWYDQERGVVQRRYGYVNDAANDMRAAQLYRWKVNEVKRDGKRLEPKFGSSWWRELWSPQLVRLPDGSIDLRVWPRFLGGRWLTIAELVQSLAPGTDRIEVTYVREDRNQRS